MKTNLPSPSRSCRAVSAARTIILFGCVLCLALLGIALVFSGCASTPQGLQREQAIYSADTNVIASIRSVTPYLPASAGNTVEGVLALATAALAAWNTHLHSQMKTLRNGNGNGNGNGHPAANPPTGPPSPART